MLDGERSQRLFCDDSLARFGNILIFNSIVHMTRSYFHLISTLECAVPRDDIAEALLSVGPIENVVCRTAPASGMTLSNFKFGFMMGGASQLRK